MPCSTLHDSSKNLPFVIGISETEGRFQWGWDTVRYSVPAFHGPSGGTNGEQTVTHQNVSCKPFLPIEDVIFSIILVLIDAAEVPRLPLVRAFWREVMRCLKQFRGSRCKRPENVSNDFE